MSILQTNDDQTAAPWRTNTCARIGRQLLTYGVVPAVCFLGVVVGPASAQGGVPTCGGPGGPAVGELIALIEHFHALGMDIVAPAVAFFYMLAGFRWMRGTVESIETAKRDFIAATVGALLVILSGPFVRVVLQPLCGVGG